MGGRRGARRRSSRGGGGRALGDGLAGGGGGGGGGGGVGWGGWARGAAIQEWPTSAAPRSRSRCRRAPAAPATSGPARHPVWAGAAARPLLPLATPRPSHFPGRACPIKPSLLSAPAARAPHRPRPAPRRPAAPPRRRSAEPTAPARRHFRLPPDGCVRRVQDVAEPVPLQGGARAGGGAGAARCLRLAPARPQREPRLHRPVPPPPPPNASPHTHNPSTQNEVVGPLLGAVFGLVSAVVLWPMGAVVWLCSRPRGRSMLHAPAGVYSSVATPIPF
jgi:hypothetical protein